MTRADLIMMTEQHHYSAYKDAAAVTSLAPGRVNLIGEHTDYNNGHVLPVAIDFYTCVTGHASEDLTVKVTALDFQGAKDEFSLDRLEISIVEQGDWSTYVRGIFAVLKTEGYPVQGCRLTVSGNIPKGSGLSSSASMTVAVLNLVNSLFDLNLSPKRIAILCQRVENDYVGCACGIMDQLSSACGIAGKALLIDCENLSLTPASLPHDCTLVIVNSNLPRKLVESAYNERRTTCQEAASLLQAKSLREISYAHFLEEQNILPLLHQKRARHVITENDRTLSMKHAMEQSDYAKIAHLMRQSHVSMRDDFDITTPEIDDLVNIIDTYLDDRGGVRMTGGGFGGCVIALVPTSLTKGLRSQVEKNYNKRTGLTESIYICKAGSGMEIL
ncbi:galactokinase [Temperatibacter marinus]|uniref:Galactokinase n=1 Tax=Temperatibacter marinus TaxID=1456591 RepID=A0AA52EG38_9PROT|nr:galactokinase [Temperatibacter marinus]WND04095.1 galactokinase [Temperatibacter marinus]